MTCLPCIQKKHKSNAINFSDDEAPPKPLGRPPKTGQSPPDLRSITDEEGDRPQSDLCFDKQDSVGRTDHFPANLQRRLGSLSNRRMDRDIALLQRVHDETGIDATLQNEPHSLGPTFQETATRIPGDAKSFRTQPTLLDLSPEPRTNKAASYGNGLQTEGDSRLPNRFDPQVMQNVMF